MSTQNYEIEVKVLLWEKPNADILLEKLKQNDPNLKFKYENSQLNHYFINWNFDKLLANIKPLLKEEVYPKFEHIIKFGKTHSIRTRKTDTALIFIVKSTIDDTSSANGTARIEFEEKITNMNIDELDKLILDAGFVYQSKWSRHRQEYAYKDFAVTIDKNAGYGYLAEFEIVITDPSQADKYKEQIRQELETLWVEELDQGRIERMFAYYNEHWPEYYGTDKTFTLY